MGGVSSKAASAIKWNENNYLDNHLSLSGTLKTNNPAKQLKKPKNFEDQLGWGPISNYRPGGGGTTYI